MRSSNKQRGKSVAPTPNPTQNKGIASFVNAKSKIEGMANLLGNIAEAQGTQEEEKKGFVPEPQVVKQGTTVQPASSKSTLTQKPA